MRLLDTYAYKEDLQPVVLDRFAPFIPEGASRRGPVQDTAPTGNGVVVSCPQRWALVATSGGWLCVSSDSMSRIRAARWGEWGDATWVSAVVWLMAGCRRLIAKGLS